MEVDTNELLHRIGAVLRAISNKMDQLIEIVERAGGEVWFPSEEEAQTVADVLMDDACIPSGSVADEPAKEPEPEHPAGPMPDAGKGYRILKKNPPEDLQPGDEYEPVASNGDWVESENAHTNRKQGPRIWYRRKIETPKPPEPEYREPVLPGDSGKVCEFSDDNENWHRRKLAYWIKSEYGFVWWSESGDLYKYARIRKDA